MTHVSPLYALQKAVFARLAGDAELTTLLGGARIHDAVPRNAAAPYLHLGEATARDWSTSTEAGCEIRFAVVAVSDEAGRGQALAAAERVRLLLHDAALSLDGHRLVNLRHLSTETKRAHEARGRRAELRFRAVTEPLA